MQSELLHIAEPFVVAAQGDQLVVAATLDDFALVHDADLVRAADGGEAVGDDDRCAVAHEAFQCLLDEPFRFRVERRGGLVEDEQRGILEDGAGDADALALAAGELAAAVADVRVVALFGGHDEVVGVGDARRLLHFLARGGLDTEGDVVEEGVVKEDRLLIHVAHQRAQVGERRLADVHAVDGDGAPLHVVEAREEVHQRALS